MLKRYFSRTQGQVALIAAVFFFIISTVVVMSVAVPISKQVKIASDLSKSRDSFFLAESAWEDSIYRLANGYEVNTGTVNIDGEDVQITVEDDLDKKIITAESNLNSYQRKIRSEIFVGEGISFYYGVQVGAGGLQMSNNSRVEGNVYSNNSILGANGATITGSAAVASGISETPSVEWTDNDSDYFFSNNDSQIKFEWTDNDSDNFFATQSSNRDIAQSFIAEQTGPLTKASVYLAKVGNPGNITLRITEDNGGKPATWSIHSVTINASTVDTSPSWIDVTLPGWATLNSGSKYWIVLDYNSNSSSNYWNWRKDSSDNYSGNTGKTTNNWSTWNASWTDVGGDLAFRVGVGYKTDIAQSFSAISTGPLVRASFFLGKVGNPTSNITVRVTNDNNGKPSTYSLGTATINPAFIGQTPSWISTTFSNPPNLTNGNKYWLVLDTSNPSASNYWNWRLDSSNNYPGNTGRVTGDFSSGSSLWTDVDGDLAFRAWIGGENTEISNVNIGEIGRANAFTNGTSCGTECIIDNPSSQELPISDGLIQDWKSQAVAGGICGEPICDSSGNFNLSLGEFTSLGPIYISGNLTLSNDSELNVTGTIWVAGDINFSNNAEIRLDPAYDTSSGIILSDKIVNVSNNVIFNGSGSEGSYILVLSDKDDMNGNVINVSNNSVGVVYYANKGWIQFSNNATSRAAVSHGMRLSNNAVVTYESGLADITFSSGPSGGWNILNWREIK